MDNIETVMQAVEQKGKHKEARIVKDFLIIEIGSQALAIQIEYLKEVFDVVDARDVASIPFTPPYIRGIINIRGELVPVLYLSKILELECAEESNRKMVIIEHSKLRIGFPFTRISDLKTINVKDIRSIKDIRKQANSLFITEEFEFDKVTIGILDIPKLYASEFFQ